jgi:TP901-1 family phage major tail protein
MTAQKGKDLLLKLDESGGGSFETVAGLRATRLSFNSDTVDVTTAESAGNWRELLAGAGLRVAAISGSGSRGTSILDRTTRLDIDPCNGDPRRT